MIRSYDARCQCISNYWNPLVAVHSIEVSMFSKYKCLHDDCTVADLETRFSFRSVNEFPAPDDYSYCTKTYPSVVAVSKEKSEFVVCHADADARY